MNKIGECIKAVRLKRGLTLKDVADGEYSVAYLSRVERNHLEPTDRLLEHIFNKLGKELLEDLLYKGIQGERLDQIYNSYKSTSRIEYEDLLYIEIFSELPHSLVSNLKIYGILIRYYSNQKKAKKAIELFKRSQELISEELISKDKQNFFSYYFTSCGHCLYKIQDFVNADHYFTKALKLDLHGVDLANAYYNLSLTKQRLLVDDTCLIYSKHAAKLYEELGLEFHKYRTFITIGIQEYIMKDYYKAFEFLKDALLFMSKDEINNKRIISQIYYNLGNVSHKLNNIEKAVEYYNKALSINNQITHEESANIYIYRNLCKIYLESIKDFSKCDYYLSLSKSLLENYQLPYLSLEVKAIEAKYYLLQGKIKDYESKMKSIIYDSKLREYFVLWESCANELGKHFFKQRKYKQASLLLIDAMDMQKNIWRNSK